MTPAPPDLLGFHARAFNGHDLESVAGLASPGVRCIRDGKLLGEGRDAVRRALLEEYKLSEDLVARVMDLDGDAVLVEWRGAEGRGEPVGVLRVQGDDRVTELRIDHDRKAMDRLVASGR